MRKIMTSVAMVAILFAFVACGSNAQGEIEVMEDLIYQATGVDIGAVLDDVAPTSPSEEAQEITASEAAINLNLPLVVTETTFVFERNNSMRITPDGILQRQIDSEWDDIDTDVRSVFADSGAVFYIKNDNSLWGWGSNTMGQLGDNTGIDRNEPVRILDDVAWVGRVGIEHVGHGTNPELPLIGVGVIKTDRTFWLWGGQRHFEPVMIAENVVRLLPGGSWGEVQRLLTSSGTLINYISNTVLFEGSVYDAVGLGFIGNAFAIDSDRNLLSGRLSSTGVINSPEIIANDVDRILNYSHQPGVGSNLFFATLNGSLWGIGQNANGELGDGTRVPREEPVHIADSVIYAGAYFFVKQDGTLWGWDSNNPTPQQTFENVATVAGQNIHFQDGSVMVGINGVHIDDVKIPRALTFN